MKKLILLTLTLFFLITTVCSLILFAQPNNEVIKIGINAPMTGDLRKVGEATKNACEMWAEEVNQGGGIQVGDKKHLVKIVIEDNETNPEKAIKATEKLIIQGKVLAIVGPQSSAQAVPTGEIANNHKTPMISPWSSNPETTKGRPYVFRTSFLDPLQGYAVAQFMNKEFKFKKAAVLFDQSNPYCKGLAENFREVWEKRNGARSVVAIEAFSYPDKNFRSKLKKIKESDAEFLFAPQYYNEVHLIVEQAREIEFNNLIIGSDSWGDPQTINLCGEDCYGLFFTTNYTAIGAKAENKIFVERYKERFNHYPSDIAALTWDSLNVIRRGLENLNHYDNKIRKNRDALRTSMANIKKFHGITGTMDFTKDGDPIKCVVIVKISDKGQYEFYKYVCPPEKIRYQRYYGYE